MQARQRAFPLQQPTYTALELHAHMATDHPQCRFCGTRFVDEDQYGLHMMGAHPYCELCGHDFRDAAAFTEHLRSAPAHFMHAFLAGFVHCHQLSHADEFICVPVLYKQPKGKQQAGTVAEYLVFCMSHSSP